MKFPGLSMEKSLKNYVEEYGYFDRNRETLFVEIRKIKTIWLFDLDFKDDNLSTVMQAIARCYNVEIRYQSEVPNKSFTGNFSRKSNISQILNQLENQGIHCKQDGKIITVMH